MSFIRLNTRGFRTVCLALGLFLAYEGYRQIPVMTEPTLGAIAQTTSLGLSQILGTAMLIIGSFIASVSSLLEGIYAYQGWSRTKNAGAIINIVAAILIFALVAYLTWPGFQWALAATIVAVVAFYANKIVKKQSKYF
ncbi:MAG: hypothetical protein ACOX1Y_01545 [Zhaonellaceae bacterium]|jgi:hypothetical protein|nr:hypothetical protein [Clostridia bacterium]